MATLNAPHGLSVDLIALWSGLEVFIDGLNYAGGETSLKENRSFSVGNVLSLNEWVSFSGREKQAMQEILILIDFDLGFFLRILSIARVTRPMIWLFSQ